MENQESQELNQNLSILQKKFNVLTIQNEVSLFI